MADDRLLSVEEAQAQLQQFLPNVIAHNISCDLSNAEGKVLSETLICPINMPNTNLSMMDGYALNHADLKAMRALPVTQRIAAGDMPKNDLQKGSVARIFTGAMLPIGSDTVVMQEESTILDDGTVLFNMPIHKGINVRIAGSELTQGQMLLPSGTRLTPTAISLCASVGIQNLPVYKPLNIALLTTGSELVTPGNDLQLGQTYNSNGYLLAALLRDHGFNVISLGTVKDTLNSTVEILSTAAQYDAIVSTGGVSVGEEDHIRNAVESLGNIDAWRVKMKPGKPFAFGKVRKTPFFGLPGNPVSAFTTFHLFVLPSLQKLQGLIQRPITALPVIANFDFTAGNRREYLRARIIPHDRTMIADIFPNQNSSVIASAHWAEGFVPIQALQIVKKGDPLGFIPFSHFKQ